MARVTVYVPDDVKARMDEVGELVNWSSVAQRAFSEAALIKMARKDPSNMEHVVERLRASKGRIAERELEYGRRLGKEWASETAEYDELRRVANFNLKRARLDPMSDFLRRLIDPEWELIHRDDNPQDFWDQFGMTAVPSDEAVRGFIEGAAEVWEQVADKL